MNPSKPIMYEICVEEHLSSNWMTWFDGLAIQIEFDAEGIPVTTISGIIPDQSALHGLFSKIRDLGLTIRSVRRIEN